MKRLFPCLSFQPRCVFAAVSSLSLLTPAWGAGLTGSETDPIGLATDSVTLEGGAAPGVWIQSGSHTIDALSDSGTLSVSGSPGISVTGDGSLLMVNSAGSLSLSGTSAALSVSALGASVFVNDQESASTVSVTGNIDVTGSQSIAYLTLTGRSPILRGNAAARGGGSVYLISTPDTDSKSTVSGGLSAIGADSILDLSGSGRTAFEGALTAADGGKVHIAAGDTSSFTVTSGLATGTGSEIESDARGTTELSGNLRAELGAAASENLYESSAGTGALSASGTGSVIRLGISGKAGFTGTVTAESGADAEVTLTDTGVIEGTGTGSSLVFQSTGAGSTLDLDIGTGTAATGDLKVSDGAEAALRISGTWNGAALLDSGTSKVSLSGGLWTLTGDSAVSTLVANNSRIAFPAAGSGAFQGTTLTVAGDYLASNTSLSMTTVLGGDDSPTDRLVVNGNTAGDTSITVTNAGGAGGLTVEGIELVTVKGKSDGVFTLANRVAAGAYDYSLVTKNGNWYLVSAADGTVPQTDPTPAEPEKTPGTPSVEKVIIPTPAPANASGDESGDEKTLDPDTTPSPDPAPGNDPAPTEVTPSPAPEITRHAVRPEMASYAANLYAANTLFLHRLTDRIGVRGAGDRGVSASGPGFWLRTAGSHTRFGMADGELTTRSNSGVVQFGGDIAAKPVSENSIFRVGLIAGAARERSRTGSNATRYRAKGTVTGAAAGLYASLLPRNAGGLGPCADAWLQYQRFSASVSGSDLPKETYHARGLTGSVEIGYGWSLGAWTSDSGVTHQTIGKLELQAIRMGVRAGTHRDSVGTGIESTGSGNLRIRVTAVLSHRMNQEDSGLSLTPYASLSWIHDTKTFGAGMDGVRDVISGNRNLAELRGGIEGEVSKSVTLWGHAAYRAGRSDFRSIGAQLGLRVKF